MARQLKSIDGNEAAAHVAYAFTEVAAIYPITPSSVMAEHADEWAAEDRMNIFGQKVKIAEMQAESGAAGAVHGSLLSGALTTTFTASQGLLLMIPNMYKMAAEQLPGVIHVSARTVATHALSIFGDHSDVMACRGTGYAMLASCNPQEIMDLGAVAHLAAISGRQAFIHFFDGFRTSHEIQKVALWDYEDLKDMVDMDAIAEFKKTGLNPNHPVMRGSAQNPDIFFQVREASNTHYDGIVDVVEQAMAKVNAKIGTDYKPFNYYGAPDAEYVVVAMGSSCDAIEEVVDYLNAQGCKTGLVRVHLYRPFSARHLLAVIPETVKSIAVLDRTKEPGSLGEPLYLDVVAALKGSKLENATIIGGRYGLSSKDTSASAYLSVFRNLMKDAPKHPFTIGITDDVTHLSLPMDEIVDMQAKGNKACKFWGLGSDGTVGANKNSIKIIGDHTDLKIQAYFQYDSKKSGGVTISHLRFGPEPIRSTYYCSSSDFVACHNASYLEKYPMVQDVKPGGIFLINCGYDAATLGEKLPADAKQYIAKNDIQVYTIDAVKLGKELGLGNKYNMILQSAFFKLAEIIPIDDAVTYMKDAIVTTYGKKGADIVAKNQAAVDAGLTGLNKIDIPADWANAADAAADSGVDCADPALKQFVEEILIPENAMMGDSIPVSVVTRNGMVDGAIPQGTAAYEKRGIAVDVPVWLPENCIQCNQCAYVCPHAAIRPFVLTEEEVKGAPAGTKVVKLNGKGTDGLFFSMQTSVMDCTGCGSCANVCPAKNKALVMQPLEENMAAQEQYGYCFGQVSQKELPFAADTVKGSQFRQPLFEFSGACAGCGETPYPKLITQLFGDRMIIANATGCSSIWASSVPSTPYTMNAEGRGPAWANSLFEDNAEFGFGIHLGVTQQRAKLADLVQVMLNDATVPADVKAAGEAWWAVKDAGEESRIPGRAFEAALAGCQAESAKAVYAMKDLLVRPSVWIFGGDGWAFDIGFGGLDHVLASGEDVNVFVFNTEVYSNTGGQASKASNIGQVAEFAAAGKETKSKSLAEMAMTYGYVYVAQVAMGANMNQTLKAIREAEAWHGPSLIIGYSPCEMHSIKGGMSNSQMEMKMAVDCGYWNLFRFNPAEEKPFSLDSKEPKDGYQDFLKNEARYARLFTEFPDRAESLFERNEENAKQRYQHLLKLKALYE